MQHRKKCKTYGCRNPACDSRGYCEECVARHGASSCANALPENRGKTAERGYGYRWQKFARGYLSRNPVCAVCGAPSEVVDHMSMPADIMLEMYGRFDLDERNYQALCQTCNKRKAHREDKAMRMEFHQTVSELKTGVSEKKGPCEHDQRK